MRMTNAEADGHMGIIVVGTGRSGTSLAMQALGALGVSLPQEVVPPSEHNPRGTGEAIEVRDRMLDLNVRLGRVVAHRPEDWQRHPAARETVTWIENYLRVSKEKSGPHGFAVKFPLASLFLPLWKEGAERAGVKLRMIWATRDARQTIRSLIRSDNATIVQSSRVWAQRNYYVLRDAPPDTLLLPYEGWRTDVEGQMVVLAQATGVTDSNILARAKQQFLAPLDHTTDDAETLAPTAAEVASRIDSAIVGKSGQLDEIIDADLRDELSSLLWQILPELQKMSAKMQGAKSDERREEHIRAQLSDARKAYEALSMQRDRLEEDIRSRFQHMLQLSETRLSRAQAGQDKARDLNQRLKRRIAALVEQEKETKHLAAELASLRQRSEKMKVALDAMRVDLRRREARLKGILSSRSWRLTAPLRGLLPRSKR